MEVEMPTRNGGMNNQMDNGGGGMGGFGGQSRGGGGGQMSPGGSMGGDIIGQTMGGPGFVWRPNGPGNNFGAGDRPAQFTAQMAELQRRCLAGDGNACQQLQIKEMWQGQEQQEWQDQYQQGQRFYQPSQGISANKWG